ncbi:MAG TPA: DUF2169 domain-containing protein [Vicinamibacterales bacterium]|jgi:hypothetical protein
MELVNSTRMVAGYTMGLEPSGRELLVVVVKGTFQIPRNGDPVRLADEQLPLVMADTFTGEPGFSAPVYEVDFAPRKHRCDVLLNGSAYAPGGRPTTRVEVGIRVGAMAKSFTVVGNRRWQSGIRGATASAPEPFAVMPISYDRAFGGIDNRHEDPSRHAAFMRNPVGTGFHRDLRPAWVDGSPMPNTEESNRAITAPDAQAPLPMSFGPLGRGWDPRYKYAGTYDDIWLEDHFPFLPPDFDEQYYQAAPLDQQIAHPRGGEELRLVNLASDGEVAFILPVFDAPIHFFPEQGQREDGKLALDTIVLEPDRRRFTLTWRTTRPLRKNMLEVAQVLVGKKSQAWWADRETPAFPLRLVSVASEHKNGTNTSSPSDRLP